MYSDILKHEEYLKIKVISIFKFQNEYRSKTTTTCSTSIEATILYPRQIWSMLCVTSQETNDAKLTDVLKIRVPLNIFKNCVHFKQQNYNTETLNIKLY